jgi:predicted PurR-regulated permease PerM
VGAIPIIIVLLLAKDWSTSLWVLLAFTLLHVLESKFLMPAVLGRQLRLHPVLIIVSLLIGAQVGGLLGMFLAAPVLAVIRTLVEDRRHEEEQAAEAAPGVVPG